MVESKAPQLIEHVTTVKEDDVEVEDMAFEAEPIAGIAGAVAAATTAVAAAVEGAVCVASAVVAAVVDVASSVTPEGEAVSSDNKEGAEEDADQEGQEQGEEGEEEEQEEEEGPGGVLPPPEGKVRLNVHTHLFCLCEHSLLPQPIFDLLRHR